MKHSSLGAPCAAHVALSLPACPGGFTDSGPGGACSLAGEQAESRSTAATTHARGSRFRFKSVGLMIVLPHFDSPLFGAPPAALAGYWATCRQRFGCMSARPLWLGSRFGVWSVLHSRDGSKRTGSGRSYGEGSDQQNDGA